jgi:multiple sugar transport system permease protein
MTQSTEVLASPSPRIGRSRWKLSPSARAAGWGYVFIGPWLIGLLLFTAGPMIASMVLSFTAFGLLQPNAWRSPGVNTT